MSSPQSLTTVRRSVALPARLVQEILELAPKEEGQNFNRLVRVALEEYIQAHRTRAFAQAMSDMAHDPAIRRESAAITRAFRSAEADGLPNEP